MLVDKCGNYTRDGISDVFPEHGYAISLPESEILTLSSHSCTHIELKASFKEGAYPKKTVSVPEKKWRKGVNKNRKAS